MVEDWQQPSGEVSGRKDLPVKNGSERAETASSGSPEIISDAADAILEIEQGLLDGEEHTTCETFAAELLDRKACWLVGAKEVVLRKIKMGMDLSEKDKNYIAEHLK